MEWKENDRAMVKVSRCDGKSGVYLIFQDRPDHSYWVPSSLLHPFPAADRLTGLERAVVEAAEAFDSTSATFAANPTNETGNRSVEAQNLLHSALAALRAARTPPDPVQELLVAAKYYHRVTTPERYHRLKRAIAAMEARGDRK